MKANNILATIGNTPHVRINRLFGPGHEVWIKAEQAKGFSLYMLKAIISGRGDEVVELARTNLLR